MNKLIALSFSLAALLSLSIHAQEKNHPCKKIQAACESAGFVKGAHKQNGKGLYVDCMKKVLDGQTVEGVTVTTEDITGCKEKRAEHQAKKAQKKAETKTK